MGNNPWSWHQLRPWHRKAEAFEHDVDMTVKDGNIPLRKKNLSRVTVGEIS